MQEKAKNTNIIKKTSSIVSYLLFAVIIVIIATVLFQIITGRETQVFGYRLYVVVTDSMTPELEVGDVILSKSIEPEDIKIDDVVTFIGVEGAQKGLIITHKVVREPYYEEGKGYILTQGVKQFSTVDPPVPLENVQAVMVRKMTLLSGLFRLLRTPFGFILMIFMPLLLITIIQLVKVTKKSYNKELKEALAKDKQNIEEVIVKELKEKQEKENSIRDEEDIR